MTPTEELKKAFEERFSEMLFLLKKHDYAHDFRSSLLSFIAEREAVAERRGYRKGMTRMGSELGGQSEQLDKKITALLTPDNKDEI